MTVHAHGTIERYWTGCSCAACTARGTRPDAKRSPRRAKGSRGHFPSQVRSHVLPTGELSVYCWCGSAIVYVAPEVIRACQTDTCGLPDCHAPEAA